MAFAVELESIAKFYSLGVGRSGYRTLRETLADRFGKREQQDSLRKIWALRDVSFQVEQGTALGIVGRNGAGKTTLLRILARITEPSEGVARTRGSVGALLEVGAGFHPELTGAENIYLGGAVLGMKRREVRARFDEIVAFAEVERFLDTPMKRYSAGMYLRLAFSVAANLLSDILVVDEVLAVGDVEFQHRCLGKVGELSEEGRTVLFVSHDPGAVARLCDRAIWLESGRVHREGQAKEVVEAYVEKMLSAGTNVDLPQTAGSVVLERITLIDPNGHPTTTPGRGEPLRISLVLDVTETVPALDVAVYIVDSHGRRVLDDALSDHISPSISRVRKERTVTVTIPGILRAGEYALGVWIRSRHDDPYLDRELLSFRVAPRSEDSAPALRRERVVQPRVTWDIGDA